MENNLKNIGIIAQIIVAIFTLTFVIFYFLEPEFLIALQSLIALFMFILAYNNHITFKRSKIYTITSIIVGILIIGSTIL